MARAIHSCSAEGDQRITISVPDVIGCIALRRSGGLVAGLGRSFAFVDLPDGKITAFANPEEEVLGNRFNDGKCDRQGRFWAGTMDLRATRPTGTLYRLDTKLRVAPVLSGLAITNGVGWSPDDKTLYVTDSNNREILAFDFDAHSGEVSGRREFARVPATDGFPDGLTVSADGDVWSAHWDGWRVTRYSAGGAVREIIWMPVPRPTSCMFGGADLSTLFVTSATDGLTDEELDNAPLSGGLFAVSTGAVGLSEPSFAG